jgi:hypothetical protein
LSSRGSGPYVFFGESNSCAWWGMILPCHVQRIEDGVQVVWCYLVR